MIAFFLFFFARTHTCAGVTDVRVCWFYAAGVCCRCFFARWRAGVLVGGLLVAGC